MDEIQNNLKYILCELLNDETVQENIVNIVKKKNLDKNWKN